MAGNHCSHCPGSDATAIASALLALVLAFLAVLFVMAHLLLIAALLAVFALCAFALVFVAWKYGPQLAGFHVYRVTPPRRTQAVTARVVRPLPARQPAAIEAPKTVHSAYVIREAVPQPRKAQS